MHRRRLSRRGKTVTFFLFFVFFLLWLWQQFLPVAEAAAETAAVRQVETVLHEAVAEYAAWAEEEVNSLIRVARDEEGRVLSLEQNSAAVARVQSFLGENIQTRLAGTEGSVSIPLGSLTGIGFLYGHGPSVPITVTVSGSCQTQCESSFLQAGVNQTMHRVTLTMSCRVWIQLPGYGFSKELKEDVVLSETVIVGEVPQALLTTVPGSGE